MTATNNVFDDLRFIREVKYEERIGYKVLGIIAGHLDIRKVRVLKGYKVFDEIPFFDILDNAEDRGVITRKQGMDAGDVDIFLQGQTHPDQAQVYVAVEVSLAVSNEDLTRAANRAEILAKATGSPTLPVVIGATIGEARHKLAAERGVTLITVAE